MSDDLLERAFAAPDPDIVQYIASDKRVRSADGTPIGVLPRYAYISTPGSLYEIRSDEYPWQPQVAHHSLPQRVRKVPE